MAVADDAIVVRKDRCRLVEGLVLAVESDNCVAALNTDLLGATLAEHLQESQLGFADGVRKLQRKLSKRQLKTKLS